MDRLRALAETNGFFTRAEALDLGLDDRSISRVMRAEGWQRVRPGAYTFADLWPSEPHLRHRLIGRAAHRKLEGRVALSHTTAAVEHGFDIWDLDLSEVHVTRLTGTSGRHQAGIVHHEGLLTPADVVEVDGRLVTRQARTAFDAASLASSEAALVLFDQLIRRGGPAATKELATLGELHDHWPSTQHLRLPIQLADGRSESVGESRSRWFFFQWGIPAPQLQFKVFDRGMLLGRSDFAWPEYRLLGEFDGKRKYVELLREGETLDDVLLRERRRENLMCAFLGWPMVRITWADLHSPQQTADRIRRLLERAA